MLWTDERIYRAITRLGQWSRGASGREYLQVLDDDVEDLLMQMRDEYEAKLDELTQKQVDDEGFADAYATHVNFADQF